MNKSSVGLALMMGILLTGIAGRYGAAQKASFAEGTLKFQFNWDLNGAGDVVTNALKTAK